MKENFKTVICTSMWLWFIVDIKWSFFYWACWVRLSIKLLSTFLTNYVMIYSCLISGFNMFYHCFTVFQNRADIKHFLKHFLNVEMHIYKHVFYLALTFWYHIAIHCLLYLIFCRLSISTLSVWVIFVTCVMIYACQ